MANPSRVAELANIISTNTAKVTAYLTEHNLPHPSFAVDGPSRSLIPPDAVDIETARIAVVDATDELRALMLGPQEYLTAHFAHQHLVSQHAIVHYGMPKAVPFDEPFTFDALANKVNLPESDVRRILRHATLRHIFTEPTPGVVAHNAVSRLLAESQTLTDYLMVSYDDLWPAASKVVDAMEKYPASEEPNEAGFNVAFSDDRPIYMAFAANPERSRRFANAMTLFTEGPPFDVGHMVKGYDWGSLGEGATVVDIGGSHGIHCQAIAAAHPSLKFVIQDLGFVVDSAPALSGTDADKFKFMAYDFFEPQPVKNADAYFFRWIFHNWSDKYCVKILQNLIPALKPGARVIVGDNVLPPPGVLSRYHEDGIRSMDLCMKEMLNAKERDLDEWRGLFEAADKRFVFKGGKQPEGSMLWVMEAVWEG